VNCLICKDLERTFVSRRSQYTEALSAAYYRVTTELAACKNVDMERAKSDLEEHQSICIYAANRKRPRPGASPARLESAPSLGAGNS
jgi:hypothetical protein